MPNIAFDPQCFSIISSYSAGSVSLQSLRTKATDNFENSSSELFRPKKSRKFGKQNSPKIQEGADHEHFRKLTSSMDPTSTDVKITPLDPMWAEKLWIKIKLKISGKAGLPHPPRIMSLKTSQQDLQMLRV